MRMLQQELELVKDQNAPIPLLHYLTEPYRSLAVRHPSNMLLVTTSRQSAEGSQAEG